MWTGEHVHTHFAIKPATWSARRARPEKLAFVALIQTCTCQHVHVLLTTCLPSSSALVGGLPSSLMSEVVVVCTSTLFPPSFLRRSAEDKRTQIPAEYLQLQPCRCCVFALGCFTRAQGSTGLLSDEHQKLLTRLDLLSDFSPPAADPAVFTPQTLFSDTCCASRKQVSVPLIRTQPCGDSAEKPPVECVVCVPESSQCARTMWSTGRY